MADKYNGAFTGAQIDEAVGKALNGTLMNAKTYDPQGKATDIFKYVDEHAPSGGSGVHIGPEPPTNGETVWIDTDDQQGSFYTAKQVDELLTKAVRMIPVWKNASPLSVFAEQTVGRTTTPHKIFIVKFAGANVNGVENHYIIARLNELCRLGVPSYGGAGVINLWRSFTIGDSDIKFDNCRKNESTDNMFCIPVEVFGLEGVTVNE